MKVNKILTGDDLILIRLEKNPLVKMETGDIFNDYEFFVEDSTVQNKEEIRNLKAILPSTLFNFTSPVEIDEDKYIVISANNLICVVK